MERIQVAWSGDPVVGPGLSTFYTDEASGEPVMAPLVTFFTAIRSLFPNGITWTIPTGGDLINESSGALAGTFTESGGGTVASNGGTGAFAAGVGARIVWKTAAIRGGRRVRGSTFLVPLIVGAYQNNGTLTDANVTTMNAAASALLSSVPGLRVWSRPRPDLAGAMVPITSAELPDKVSWLRSRRI